MDSVSHYGQTPFIWIGEANFGLPLFLFCDPTTFWHFANQDNETDESQNNFNAFAPPFGANNVFSIESSAHEKFASEMKSIS